MYCTQSIYSYKINNFKCYCPENVSALAKTILAEGLCFENRTLASICDLPMVLNQDLTQPYVQKSIIHSFKNITWTATKNTTI